MAAFDMICCIVKHEQGSKALRAAKRCGVRGGTMCLGRGTVKNKLLSMLALNEAPEEIVLMIAEHELIPQTVQVLTEEMHLDKPGHGIVFTTPLSHFLGMKHYEYDDGGEPERMSAVDAIFTVVDKGLAEEVVDVADAAGARGGTIINARGSGIHESNVVFAMAIEPEKEIVLILAEESLTEKITEAIREHMHIDKPNHGIIFIMKVENAVGLR